MLLIFEFRHKLGGLESRELTVFDEDTGQGFRGDTDLGLLEHFLKFDDTLGVQETFVFEHLNELRCAHGLVKLLANRDTETAKTSLATGIQRSDNRCMILHENRGTFEEKWNKTDSGAGERADKG